MANGFRVPDFDPFGNTRKKKRNLTYAQKIWCWENKPHTCNICGKRVTKFSDAEFDHTRAHSKGGATNLKNIKIVHRTCHKMKGTKSLSETKKFLGIKSSKKKTTKKRKSQKEDDSFGVRINPKDFEIRF